MFNAKCMNMNKLSIMLKKTDEKLSIKISQIIVLFILKKEIQFQHQYQQITKIQILLFQNLEKMS